MIAFIANHWKLGLIAVAAIGLVLGGWKVNAWRARAIEADRLEVQLTAERKRTKKAEQDRILVSAQLAATEEETRIEVREVVKRVRVLVPDNRACDLDVDAVKALNKARGY